MDHPGKAIRSPAAPVYHLADRWIPAPSPRRSGFSSKRANRPELWERALAPLGQKLLGEVIDYAKTHKTLPANPRTSICDPRPELGSNLIPTAAIRPESPLLDWSGQISVPRPDQNLTSNV